LACSNAGVVGSGQGFSPSHGRPDRPPSLRVVTFAPSCILLTGGAGFIGSNFIRWLLRQSPTVRVVNIDLLTYAGNLESLQDVVQAHGPDAHGRYQFGDDHARDLDLVQELLRGEDPSGPAPDHIMHIA